MTSLTRIKPALGRIILEQVSESDRSEAGLYLVSHKEQSGSICTVAAVCDPYRSSVNGEIEGPEYAVGDTVLIGKYNGVDITIGRQRFIAVKESDVIGTLLPAEETFQAHPFRRSAGTDNCRDCAKPKAAHGVTI